MLIRFALRLLLAASCAGFSAGQVFSQGQTIVYVNQGPDWTPATRSDFYRRDQGSKLIQLAWLRALKQSNGQPFLADSLGRYGYLANPTNGNGLPVGFTASGPIGIRTVGITCSACHTRQIEVDGTAYRIDGGPAIVDFQRFLADLDAAVGSILTSDTVFAPFAADVLGSPSPHGQDVSTLRRDVEAWYLRFHALVTRALPKAPSTPWGPARIDAVGMIFNRLTGLDLGPPPSLLILDNIRTADVPVRYPFLWNAPKQDQTQWPGFADNGSDILALGRNLGEVFGVFAVFEPKKEGLVINFLNNNSANFDGLDKLEDLIKRIGPPKWPWPVVATLAAQGKAIYERPSAQGGCVECHAIRPGKVRFPLQQTWATPVQNVGTDTRQYDLLTRTAKSGVLQGAFIPFLTQPLEETDLAFNILATSVLGSIAEHALSTGGTAVAASEQAAPNSMSTPNTKVFRPAQVSGPLPPALRELQGAFRLPGAATPAIAGAAAPLKGAYEARVMEGIWAAAPYLHNGSVPTLAELLKPASERVKKFRIGSAYDTTNIGLATHQTQFDYELVTTDCSGRNSGNSRCGHEFGTTQLSDTEKKALLEYLKTL